MHQQNLDLEVSDQLVKNAFETYMEQAAARQHCMWRHKILKSCAPAASRAAAQQKYAEEKRNARFRDSVLEQHNESQRTLSASRGRVTQALEELQKTKQDLTDTKADYHLRVRSILLPLSVNLKYNNFLIHENRESQNEESTRDSQSSLSESQLVKPKQPQRIRALSVPRYRQKRLSTIPNNRLPAITNKKIEQKRGFLVAKNVKNPTVDIQRV